MNGSCQTLAAPECATARAEYIGDGTSCADVDCAAPLAVPMLSIVGVVGLFGALGGFGVYRLTFGRRARS